MDDELRASLARYIPQAPMGDIIHVPVFPDLSVNHANSYDEIQFPEAVSSHMYAWNRQTLDWQLLDDKPQEIKIVKPDKPVVKQKGWILEK